MLILRGIIEVPTFDYSAKPLRSERNNQVVGDLWLRPLFKSLSPRYSGGASLSILSHMDMGVCFYRGVREVKSLCKQDDIYNSRNFIVSLQNKMREKAKRPLSPR
jgi:hypothetical protein